MQRRIECLQHDAHAASSDDFRDLIHTEPPDRTGLVGRLQEIERLRGRVRGRSGSLPRGLDELILFHLLKRLGENRPVRLRRLVSQMSDRRIPRLAPSHQPFERRLTRETSVHMPLHRGLFRCSERSIEQRLQLVRCQTVVG